MGRRPGRGGMLHGTDRLRAPGARCLSACAYTQIGPNRRADIQPCPQPEAQLTKNPHIGYCPCQVGDGGQSVLSAALFRFSRAGRQAVVTTKFELRRFTPQKKIPLISFHLSAGRGCIYAGRFYRMPYESESNRYVRSE
jgi:hypothetical protein